MAQQSRIARILTALITLPFLLLAVLFAVSNREAVEITLWPLPYAATLPLFVTILAMLFLGFLIGAGFMWIEVLRTRRQIRILRRVADQQEQELNRLRRDKRLAVDPDGVPNLPATGKPSDTAPTLPTTH
ncbi:LapA family protein [Oceanibaculum indicum]|uniref:Lipopolysaccharide assembly protein A domain-containing protein n=1 Tax=Oceanibaculum indicum P24 TaxID=1207063 RepID=K2J1S5_9PROT|nr:LapA family protein [Oceanibaculum indicum]EKE76936.1 hypothetical protein P24_07026 [Oceanibaculum indicum P24]